jgi:hypothetical protein
MFNILSFARKSKRNIQFKKTKFKFIVSVVTNRPLTGVFGKIQEYINYFVNFGNSNLYEDNNAQQNVQPQQPMYQQNQQ